jgi:hypothetical protein
MSREQREALDAQLREAPLDLGGELPSSEWSSRR